jgi:hypothetical protein
MLFQLLNLDGEEQLVTSKAATTFLATQKIVLPLCLVQQYLVVVPPASELTDPPLQPVVTQVDLVVEDQALERDEKESETVGIWSIGICLPTLTSILASNPSLIKKKWFSIFPAGCICHNKCQINLSEEDIISGRISSSHELIGFADDVNSFDYIIFSFLQDANGPSHNLPTYVNQWIYRSSCGMTLPCEFFYDSTSLNGQTVVNQWYPVVSSCKAIRCKVLRTSSDAGGGNVSFFLPFKVEKDCDLRLLDFGGVYKSASSFQSKALDIPPALHDTFDEIDEEHGLKQQTQWFKTIPQSK